MLRRERKQWQSPTEQTQRIPTGCSVSRVSLPLALPFFADTPGIGQHENSRNAPFIPTGRCCISLAWIMDLGMRQGSREKGKSP